MKNNLLIAMSGGTTTVINSTLAGIIETAQKCPTIDHIYAGSPGLIGILNEKLSDLTNLSSPQVHRLKMTPCSGFIGTTRVKHLSSGNLDRFGDVCEAHNIKYFINIGGNGTLKQTKQIATYFNSRLNTASVPKTVDNDLGDAQFSKMHYTPGYPSCANYWLHKTMLYNQENLGAYSHDRILIVQTFGRQTGFLTAAARLADLERKLPLILLMPEDQRPLDSVLSKIDDTVTRFDRAIVVITEGYQIDNFKMAKDHSGQVMYGSSRNTAAQALVNNCMDTGLQARACIPGFDQRCEISYTLNHDLSSAYDLGKHVIDCFSKGETRFLASVGWNADTNSNYLHTIPLDAITDYSRNMPNHWIDPHNFDVSEDFIKYASEIVLGRQVLSGSPLDFSDFIAPSNCNVDKLLPITSNCTN